MAHQYQINLAPAAQRQLKKLPRSISLFILKRLEALKVNPRPHGVKKLSSIDDLYRVRIGDYRAIYTINDRHLLILIVKIGDRKEIYRDL